MKHLDVLEIRFKNLPVMSHYGPESISMDTIEGLAEVKLRSTLCTSPRCFSVQKFDLNILFLL